MAKIKRMSEALANQIAAGEVVERPASVVKELVENAIDAQASQIDIHLKEAGIQWIEVSDNGEGMVPEDLEMAFQAHASSKVYDAYDLHHIHTLGFRGEALASIASVAKVYAESMPDKALEGAFIEIAGGTLVDHGPSRAKKGSRIVVKSLFYNTPARLKHLKTITTELRHSVNYVQNIALAFPNIRFHLYHDGNLLFSSIGNGDLRQAIASVYQPVLARELLKFEVEDEDFKVQGYVSPPKVTRAQRSHIHWFMNGRPIQSYALDRILIDSYGKRLMIGRYPVAILHIALDPQLVDANVHPRKQIVRLSKEEELGELLQGAMHQLFELLNPIPHAIDNYEETLPLPLERPAPLNRQNVQEKSADFHYTKKPNALKDINEEAVTEVEDVEQEDEQEVAWPTLHYLGQIHGTYLIAEHADGFYLIDQHAAQEKIRYEELMRQEPSIMEQQALLFPLLLSFSLEEMLIIEELIPRLKDLGLYLDVFGPQTYQMESHPLWVSADALENTIRELLKLLEQKPQLTINELIEEKIIMQACRGSIKANHRLADTQARQLIKDLSQLKDPYHCPHGRPILLAFTLRDLEKLFKRIQDHH